MNKNDTNAAPGIGAAAVEPHKPKAHGELLPIEPTPPRETPVLPIVLRGNGITHNLDYEESVQRYGLWTVSMLKTCWVRGRLLKLGDSAQLDGATVQYLVGSGKAKVDDPQLEAECKIIDQAAALGLPQKIRELVSFAKPKKKKWVLQPEEQ